MSLDSKPAAISFDISHIRSKVDELNEDPETFEANITWEIERDWNATYYRRSKKILVKNIRKCDLKIEECCNIRKQVGFEGELLVRWNNGQRDWCYVSVIMSEHKNSYIT
jgi:hypothetical protein